MAMVTSLHLAPCDTLHICVKPTVIVFDFAAGFTRMDSVLSSCTVSECTVALVTVRSFVPTRSSRSQCRRTSISVLPLATSGASSAHCTVAYSTSSDSTLEARETRPASSAKALASAQMRTTPWCAGDR